MSAKGFSLPFLPPLVLQSPIPPLSLLFSLPASSFSDNNAGEGVQKQQQEEEGRQGFYRPAERGVCVCVLHSI